MHTLVLIPKLLATKQISELMQLGTSIITITSTFSKHLDRNCGWLANWIGYSTGQTYQWGVTNFFLSESLPGFLVNVPLATRNVMWFILYDAMSTFRGDRSWAFKGNMKIAAWPAWFPNFFFLFVSAIFPRLLSKHSFTWRVVSPTHDFPPFSSRI